MADGLAMRPSVAGGTGGGNWLQDLLGGGQPQAPVNYGQSLAGGGFSPEQIAAMNPLEQIQAYKAAGMGETGGMTGSDWMKGGLGVGQLGLGVASYMDQSKTNEMNRRLMGQQYSSNVESLANRRADRANVQQAFA